MAILLARRIPFEQPLVRDEHPPGRAHDRIQAEERLVRQAGERERRLGEVPAALRAMPRRDAAAAARRPAFWNRSRTERDQGRNQDDPDHRQGPEPRGRQDRPAQQQQERQRRRDETAPQVVEELPLRQHARADSSGGSPLAGNARQQPPRKLPVAANPAVPAAHVRAVAGGIVLVQLHVAQQPGARVAAFEQIVAQDPVLGEASPERPLERIDVVDPLADERAFAGTGPGRHPRRRACTGRCRARPRTAAHSATGSCRAGSRPRAAAGCRSPRDTPLPASS